MNFLKIDNSYELLLELKKDDLLKNSPKYWWPNAGSFEVVIGVVLTQNTKWESVEKSLSNLKGYLELDNFLKLDINTIKEAIKSSGFYNQKSVRLYNLAKNIKAEFESFENFKNSVNREWLLNQKGIGFESADSILCYACLREAFVVDSYSNRLVKSYGYEFESYSELQEWFEDGIKSNWSQLSSLYEDNLNLCYARYHGKIVEYLKRAKNRL